MLLPLARRACLPARPILPFSFSPLLWCVDGLDGTQNEHECLFLAVSTLSCFYTVIASLSDSSSLLSSLLTNSDEVNSTLLATRFTSNLAAT
ncbi:hypothetical protein BDN70DRAFT_568284 [Pholiota conissans]|uniref:Uncharacterized protein n=1 Tax=Pholiota conissans TaxID=109636 RepID=A0A9P5YKF7_9AGAR|nr:hypothetical protein BDN70DRAFT_568284 [Pholiota conissans]